MCQDQPRPALSLVILVHTRLLQLCCGLRNVSGSAVHTEQDLYEYIPQYRQRNRQLPIAADTVLWRELGFGTNLVILLHFPSGTDGKNGLAGSWISVSQHPRRSVSSRRANTTIATHQGAGGPMDAGAHLCCLHVGGLVKTKGWVCLGKTWSPAPAPASCQLPNS